MLLKNLSPWFARRWPAMAAAVAVAAAGGVGFFALKLHRAQAAVSMQMVQLPGERGAGQLGSGTMPISASLTAANQPPPLLRASKAAFDEACLRPIRLKRFDEAIEACNRFTNVRERAGHAHAALAAIYATRSYSNSAASVMHAQLAAEAGDGRGKFMVAFHSLTGQNPQPFDLDRTRALLVEAKANGVAKAQQYIDIVDASKRCRDQAAFRLFDAPVFCLFRPELTQLLSSKGMTESQKDLEHWIDVYRPGDVLASADRAEVTYDRDPQEELHRLARFAYIFNPQDGVDRMELLRKVLVEKYGKLQPMDATRETGGHSEWRLPDGVAIALGKDADGTVTVTYTLPKRWEDRTAHLKRERELEQSAQLIRDQVAL
jgi:hypothetical protein